MDINRKQAVLAAVVCLGLLATPISAKTFERKVKYKVKDDCVQSIGKPNKVSINPKKHRERKNKGEDSTVVWKLDGKAVSGYSWKIEKKSSSYDVCPNPIQFSSSGGATCDTANQAEDENEWEYKVVAVYDGTASCNNIETDPKIIFRNGAEFFLTSPVVLVAIAIGAVLLGIVTFALARRRRRAI